MNYLGNAIMSTEEGKAKYDAKMKEVLSNKQVLSWILKRFVPEYADCSLDDIEHRYIEPETLLVSKLGVARNSTSIEGLTTEDKTEKEGTVYYDIVFRAWHPGKKGEKIGLYINVEAQNAYYKGYPLEMRGVYYAARRLSMQLGELTQSTDYGSLQKVYSIWLCMGDVPGYEANTVSLYELCKNDIIGHVERAAETYDLLSVIVLRFNDKKKTEDKTLTMLQTLCSDRISGKEKIRRLKTMGIRFDLKLTEGVNEMCNLSDLVENRGIEKAEKASALAFLRDGLSYERVARVMKISVETLKEWEKESQEAE